MAKVTISEVDVFPTAIGAGELSELAKFAVDMPFDKPYRIGPFNSREEAELERTHLLRAYQICKDAKFQTRVRDYYGKPTRDGERFLFLLKVHKE